MVQICRDIIDYVKYSYPRPMKWGLKIFSFLHWDQKILSVNVGVSKYYDQ
jgi:hypothetical protein